MFRLVRLETRHPLRPPDRAVWSTYYVPNRLVGSTRRGGKSTRRETGWQSIGTPKAYPSAKVARGALTRLLASQVAANLYTYVIEEVGPDGNVLQTIPYTQE